MQYQDHRLASYSTHYATIATSTTTTTKSRSTISKASSSSSSSSSTVEWPLTYPSLTPEALAQAGFYFTPDDADDEEDDQVTCFLCEKKLGGWEEGDDPLEEHAKRGDRCGWAKAVCGVLLEAKEKKEKSGKGRKGKSSTSTITEPPSSEIMHDARLATFGPSTGKSSWWPHSRRKGFLPTPATLAKAGFVYTPTPDDADCVTCFYCSYSVAGWEATDNPRELHRKKSPNCRVFEDQSEEEEAVDVVAEDVDVEVEEQEELVAPKPTSRSKPTKRPTTARTARSRKTAAEGQPELEPAAELEVVAVSIPEAEAAAAETDAAPEAVPEPTKKRTTRKTAASTASSTKSKTKTKTTTTRRGKATPSASEAEASEVEAEVEREEEPIGPAQVSAPISEAEEIVDEPAPAPAVVAAKPKRATRKPSALPASKTTRTKTTRSNKAPASATSSTHSMASSEAEESPSLPVATTTDEPTPKARSGKTSNKKKVEPVAASIAEGAAEARMVLETLDTNQCTPRTIAQAAATTTATPAPLPDIAGLSLEESEMTVLDYVRQIYSNKHDALRSAGDLKIQQWTKKSAESRMVIEGIPCWDEADEDDVFKANTKSSSSKQAFLSVEQKRNLLENFDLEVADRTRVFHSALKNVLDSFLIRQESEIMRIPRDLRSQRMSTLNDIWGGDWGKTLQHLKSEVLKERKEEAMQEVTQQVEDKKKRKRGEPVPTSKEVDPGPARKTARRPPSNLSENLTATFNRAKRIVSAKKSKSTLRSIKSTNELRSPEPSAPASVATPQAASFEPTLPSSTPRFPRPLRDSEQLMSANGSPIYHPWTGGGGGGQISEGSEDELPDAEEMERQLLAASNVRPAPMLGVNKKRVSTIRIRHSGVHLNKPQLSSATATPRQQQSHHLMSAASFESPTPAPHQASDRQTTAFSPGIMTSRGALIRVTTKAGLEIDFDPMSDDPQQVENELVSEGVDAATRAQVRAEMGKRIRELQARLASWNM